MLNVSNMGEDNMADLREALGQSRVLDLQSKMGMMTDALVLSAEELRRIMDQVRNGTLDPSRDAGWE